MTDRDHKANTKQGGNGKSGAGVRRRRKLELRFVENGDILQAEEIPQKVTRNGLIMI